MKVYSVVYGWSDSPYGVTVAVNASVTTNGSLVAFVFTVDCQLKIDAVYKSLVAGGPYAEYANQSDGTGYLIKGAGAVCVVGVLVRDNGRGDWNPVLGQVTLGGTIFTIGEQVDEDSIGSETLTIITAASAGGGILLAFLGLVCLIRIRRQRFARSHAMMTRQTDPKAGPDMVVAAATKTGGERRLPLAGGR